MQNSKMCEGQQNVWINQKENTVLLSWKKWASSTSYEMELSSVGAVSPAKILFQNGTESWAEPEHSIGKDRHCLHTL